MAYWDSTVSYPYFAVVQYNGYWYRYVKTPPSSSTVGVPPNEETFTLTYDGQNISARSWTIDDNNFTRGGQPYCHKIFQAIRGVAGDPNVDLFNNQYTPRFDVQTELGLSPYISRGNRFEIGDQPNGTAGDFVSTFPAYFYGNYQEGFNAEYKSNFDWNGGWSYNIGSANLSSSPYQNLRSANDINLNQYKSATAVVLEIYVAPNQNFSATVPDPVSLLGYYNCFDKQYKFKVQRVYVSSSGSHSPQPVEDVIVSSGPFRDSPHNSPVMVLEIPLSPPTISSLSYFRVDSDIPGNEYEQLTPFYQDSPPI